MGYVYLVEFSDPNAQQEAICSEPCLDIITLFNRHAQFPKGEAYLHSREPPRLGISLAQVH